MTPGAGFKENETFDRIFLLKAISEHRTRKGKPFLTLVFGTPEGDVEARAWDMGMSSLPSLDTGDPVSARGTAVSYMERIQLNVERIEKVTTGVDPRKLYPSSHQTEAQLKEQYAGCVKRIRDKKLVSLFSVMEKDKQFMEAFFISPAATTMHHARIGGLMEHSIGVCTLTDAVAEAHSWLNRDLLIAGSLLHDIGKVREYAITGDFSFTMEGKLIGHINLGVEMFQSWLQQIPDFPARLSMDIQHIILSHHGQLEYGSPKLPATPEALVVHFADDLDAKLDMIKDASRDPDVEEAYVRGLRRMFQFSDNELSEQITEIQKEQPVSSRGKKEDQGDLF